MNRGHAAVYLARALAGGETLVPDGPSAPSFRDVPADHRAYRYVEYCAAHGVTQGYGDGTYRPYKHVTRAETAVLIARAFGLEF
jgi:hypothetical protein